MTRRSTGRFFGRFPAFVIQACLSVALSLAFATAEAATVTVNTLAVNTSGDGKCGLVEAVQAINQASTYRDCAYVFNGVGDKIAFSVSGTHLAGMLNVLRNVEIVGQGVGSTIIKSAQFCTLCSFDRDSFRMVQLRNLTVEMDGSSSFPVYGIWFRATDTVILSLDNVRVAGFKAGGIVLDGGAVEAYISNSTLEQNSAGVALRGGVLEVDSTRIRNNGTGIAASSGRVEVRRSRIENNSNTEDGGGVWITSGSAGQISVFDSLIANNHANGNGGGVYSLGQVYFYNVTFSGNSAGRGGGLYHNGAESYIYNSTFTANTSTSQGGGVYSRGGAKLYFHSIFAGNTATTNPDIDATGIAADYNLVQNTNGYGGAGTHDVLNQDPKLAPLQDMGGGTLVHPLLKGSPAIDRIPSGTFGTQPTDQRGAPRPLDGEDGGSLNGVDIGAFEQGQFETELLTVARATSGVAHTLITNDTAYSGKSGTRFAATSNDQVVTYAIPIIEAGTYSFLIRARRGNNRGIYQVATANSLDGNYTNRGPIQDLYRSTSDSVSLTLNNATATFFSAGTKYIRFTTTGRNGASSSQNLYLDWIQLKKQ